MVAARVKCDTFFFFSKGVENIRGETEDKLKGMLLF
jgi:hypothetical protein